MFILDTDHISLFQRNQPHVSARVLATPPLELATTIITVEEQLRGRLSRVGQAKTDQALVQAYHNLGATVEFFQSITVINFDAAAQAVFTQLRAQKLRLGTQDLRIAAIALSRQATVVTRNQQDFGRVPKLVIEDWSVG